MRSGAEERFHQNEGNQARSAYRIFEAIAMLAAPPSRPLALDDAQITTIMRAARILAPADRDAFLRQVAAVLELQPAIGDGVVARVCREIQQRYWVPPAIDGSGRLGAGKYAR
jgi:hypothetical protein